MKTVNARFDAKGQQTEGARVRGAGWTDREK
jgi:hypothetical protein